MTWFKTLSDGSIDSWKDLRETFTLPIHRLKPVTRDNIILSEVPKLKKGTLPKYIDLFTKVVVVVEGTNDDSKY